MRKTGQILHLLGGREGRSQTWLKSQMKTNRWFPMPVVAKNAFIRVRGGSRTGSEAAVRTGLSFLRTSAGASCGLTWGKKCPNRRKSKHEGSETRIHLPCLRNSVAGVVRVEFGGVVPGRFYLTCDVSLRVMYH